MHSSSSHTLHTWREWGGTVSASIFSGTQPTAALVTSLLKGLLEVVCDNKQLWFWLKGSFFYCIW